jgi:hypothetical protein
MFTVGGAAHLLDRHCSIWSAGNRAAGVRFGVVVGWLVLGACTPRAEAARTVSVPGSTEGLAVAAGGAFVLRRTQQPFVVRIDLASGRNDVVFRTDGFPDASFVAGGGRVAFAVDVPDPDGSQVVALDGATGAATVVRGAREDRDAGCGTRVGVGGAADTGEVIATTTIVPCHDRAAGATTVAAIGPAGERQLSRAPARTLDDAPAEWVTLAGPWTLQQSGRRTRLIDGRTGAAHEFRPTLAGVQDMAATLAPDGRAILAETRLRRRGGLVQRARVVDPGDPPRGGKVIGTVGSPPRLNATFCGTRLVVLRTRARRTRITAAGRELAQLSTPAIPRFACDATHLVVERPGTRSTRLAVIALSRPTSPP